MTTGNLRWLLWHPHQKLWNWRLVQGLQRLPGGGVLGRWVVRADTLLLWVSVIFWRALLAPRALLRSPRLPDRFLYLDCGLHRRGQELSVMAEWFGDRMTAVGFEASAEWSDDAAKALAYLPGVDVRHQALVGPAHEGDMIRLYKAGGDGRGDSLFAERGAEYEEVPAVRLSELLAEQPDMPTLLRMNIEGAELFVMEDLIDAGMLKRVTAWYGMWDDLSKIDPARDAEFRALLRRHNIKPTTFNERDLDHPWRMRAIRYDMTTSLIAA